MIWVIASYVAQLGCTAYAFWRGGSPERVAGGALLTALLATTLSPDSADPFVTVYWSIVWVDGALLVILIALALIADRFWPLWLAALQLLTMALHGVRGYDSHVLPYAYWLVVGKVAYVMMAVLIVGTWRHSKRVSVTGYERSWSFRK